MATLADSLVSSSSRPLALRMRPDLTARRQRYHGQSYWVVKEPIGLNYYRFHEEEYAILCMLDGRCSLESIKERFEQEFTPQKITFQDLQQFVGMLHRSGLVVANAIGQGHQLRKRRDQKKRRELLGKFTNVFALRWRGIDPERILNRLYPYTGWFFTKPAIIVNLLIAAVALMLVAVQFDVFRSRLPSFHQFFGNWENWLVMAIVMGAAKVLHEFGHGLSCKHYGGECHEMGFMLLVFTPALYCNVSDSWMLPSKWRRAFIGAAGMYVEMVLASSATLIWWFTDRTTLLNQTCLSLMFICSVSTLLFNGNPLLRFDGYYILMDLSEIPNLRQKSTEVLKRFLVNVCLGIEQPENPFLPQRNRFLFGLYTVAAVFYRWIVVFSILMFLNKVLEPYGLKVVGRLIGAMGFFGLVVQPMWQLGKFFYMPGRMHKVKRVRVIASLAVIAALVGAAWFLPLPFHVSCDFDVKPRDATTVYAAVAGQIDDGRSATQMILPDARQFQLTARLLKDERDGVAFLEQVDSVLELVRDRRQKENEVFDLRDDLLLDREMPEKERSRKTNRVHELEQALKAIDRQISEERLTLYPLVETLRKYMNASVVYAVMERQFDDLTSGMLASFLGPEQRLVAASLFERESDQQLFLTKITDVADVVRRLKAIESRIVEHEEASQAGSYPPASEMKAADVEQLTDDAVELRERLVDLRGDLQPLLTKLRLTIDSSELGDVNTEDLYQLMDDSFWLTVLAWDTRWTVKTGQRVEAGQVLVLLRNPESVLRVVQTEGQLRELDVQVAALRKQQRINPDAGLQINRLEEEKDALRRMLYESRDELYRLVVRAPEAGIVLPVAEKPDRDSPDGQLPKWIGAALDSKNCMAFLEPNDRICQIGDPDQLVAEIIVDQVDVDLVRDAQAKCEEKGLEGVPVDLMLDSLPGRTFRPENGIERLAMAELMATPLGLSTHAGGDVDSVADQETGMPKPLSTSYPAIAELPDTDGAVQLGMRGKAKLYTGWEPLRKRVFRFVARTFHFEF